MSRALAKDVAALLALVAVGAFIVHLLAVTS
jgi:hypothetical protein